MPANMNRQHCYNSVLSSLMLTFYSDNHILCTCKFLAERLSSSTVRCPLTLDVAATRARLPWIKAEAWPLSISNWDCRCLSTLCNSKASALHAKVASLKTKWKVKKTIQTISKNHQNWKPNTEVPSPPTENKFIFIKEESSKHIYLLEPKVRKSSHKVIKKGLLPGAGSHLSEILGRVPPIRSYSSAIFQNKMGIVIMTNLTLCSIYNMVTSKCNQRDYQGISALNYNEGTYIMIQNEYVPTKTICNMLVPM